MQTIDYENTTFKCRICRQTRHLQNAWPKYKKDSQRRKKSSKQKKGWKLPPPNLEEEGDYEEEEPIPDENSQGETRKQCPNVPMEPQSEKTSVTMEISGNKRQHISYTLV